MSISMEQALSGEGAEAQGVRPPLKIELTLGFVIGAYYAHHYVCALDALANHGDTCFHSAIAGLRKKGLEFEQRDRPHTHRHGGQALYQDYRLASGSVEKAEGMLERYRVVRLGILSAENEQRACA